MFRAKFFALFSVNSSDMSKFSQLLSVVAFVSVFPMPLVVAEVQMSASIVASRASFF